MGGGDVRSSGAVRETRPDLDFAVTCAPGRLTGRVRWPRCVAAASPSVTRTRERGTLAEPQVRLRWMDAAERGPPGQARPLRRPALAAARGGRPPVRRGGVPPRAARAAKASTATRSTSSSRARRRSSSTASSGRGSGGATSSARSHAHGRVPTADVRAETPLRCLVCRAGARGVPARPPAERCAAPGGSQAPAGRPPVAVTAPAPLSAGPVQRRRRRERARRPPDQLLAEAPRRRARRDLGRRRARRHVPTFPLFERLISWTHRGPRRARQPEYEPHDQNSLVAESRSCARSLRQQWPRTDAARHGRRWRPACAPSPSGRPSSCATVHAGRRRVTTATVWSSARATASTAARAVVVATGMTEPWVPPIPGLELDALRQRAPVPTAVSRPARRHRRQAQLRLRGRRSTRSAGRGELTSSRPGHPRSGRLARSPLRPWYLTPYDEHLRGAPGGYVLDASVERVEQDAGGYRVHALDAARRSRSTSRPTIVIAATGFRAPLGDLPQLGLETVVDGRLPALTPFWESVSLPGVYFAGNITQAAAGLRKHGVASLSGMVCRLPLQRTVTCAPHRRVGLLAQRAERPILEAWHRHVVPPRRPADPRAGAGDARDISRACSPRTPAGSGMTASSRSRSSSTEPATGSPPRSSSTTRR